MGNRAPKISKSELIDQVQGLVGNHSFVYIKNKKGALVEVGLETFAISDLQQLKNKIERKIDPIFEPLDDEDDPRTLSEDFRSFFGIDVDGGRFKNNPTSIEGSGIPGAGGAQRHSEIYRSSGERFSI